MTDKFKGSPMLSPEVMYVLNGFWCLKCEDCGIFSNTFKKPLQPTSTFCDCRAGLDLKALGKPIQDFIGDV
jgi:hypothetical protein